MKGYTSKTALENVILETIDSSFDGQVDAWIEEVENFIENYTGRVFIADVAESARLYDGDGTNTLLIDDAISVGDVQIGSDAVLDTTERFIYPANTTPKNKIVLGGDFFLSGALFTSGNQNISVKAKWGYSIACPAAIRLAATTLLLGRLQYSHNVPRQEKIGDYMISYQDTNGWESFDRAMLALDQYKKYTF